MFDLLFKQKELSTWKTAKHKTEDGDLVLHVSKQTITIKFMSIYKDYQRFVSKDSNTRYH